MDGMEGVLPGSQPSSNMPESTASNSSRNGENGIDVRLPGLDPFPESLPGTSTTSLEDIFGSSQQGTGTINSNSGAQGAGGATAGPGNINDSIVNDGSLGGGIGEQTDDPFGDLANGRNPPMTTADRQTALDARLNESIAVFDGMILTEREQAQGAANANSGNGGAGGENTNGAGGIGRNGNSDSPVVIATAPQSPSGTGRMPNMDSSREGEFDNRNQDNFPAPADIPSGNDDDVVARQLREAAMNESDPRLRERLWNEYRTYTGLPIPQEAIAEFDAIE